MTMVQSNGVVLNTRVIGFSMNTTAELGTMMHIAAAKSGLKHIEWVRKIMADAVNAAGLVHEDGTPWTYVEETKETLKEEVARMRLELAEMKALKAEQAAAAQLEAESMKDFEVVAA